MELPAPGDDPHETGETAETAGEGSDRAQPGRSTAPGASSKATDLAEHHMSTPPDTDAEIDTDEPGQSQPHQLEPTTNASGDTGGDASDGNDGGSSGTDVEDGSADDEQWPTDPQTELEPGTVVLTREDPDTRYSIDGPVDPEPGDPYYAVIEEGGRHRRLEGPIRPEHTELPTGQELTELPNEASTGRRLTRVGVEGGDDLADTWEHQIEPHIDLHQTDTQEHTEGADVTDQSPEDLELDAETIDSVMEEDLANADDEASPMLREQESFDRSQEIEERTEVQSEDPMPADQGTVTPMDFVPMLAAVFGLGAGLIARKGYTAVKDHFDRQDRDDRSL